MSVPLLLLAENTPAGGVPDPDVAAALHDRAATLNARFRHHAATDVLRGALDAVPETALVSSFGAESVVLLHMVAVTDRTLPVLFIDTGMLFAETLVYQQEVAERLRLSNVQILRATDGARAAIDPTGDLHKRDPDACCHLRKSEVLHTALAPYGAWITGRKRYQSGQRAALSFFEPDPATGRLKINPLAHWAPEDLRAYLEENRLPRHPLVARGYPSIGCAPCTSPVAAGEDARAGRWRGQDKDECGIHFVNGRMVRKGADA